MNKHFKMYAAIWAILFVVFNVVVFLVRSMIPAFSFSDAGFWVAWAFILVAFFGNLGCGYYAFKEENLQKVFYRLPLITLSRSLLIVMTIVGSVLMIIPYFPAWIAAIICILILAVNAIAISKAAWASETVSAIDEKVKTQTSFIKNLTADAEGILSRAKSDVIQAECKKVFEAIRYSDPMSNEALSVIEAKITIQMDDLASAVQANQEENVKEIADEVVNLIGDRNRKCKALKG